MCSCTNTTKVSNDEEWMPPVFIGYFITIGLWCRLWSSIMYTTSCNKHVIIGENKKLTEWGKITSIQSCSENEAF